MVHFAIFLWNPLAVGQSRLSRDLRFAPIGNWTVGQLVVGQSSVVSQQSTVNSQQSLGSL